MYYLALRWLFVGPFVLDNIFQTLVLRYIRDCWEQDEFITALLYVPANELHDFLGGCQQSLGDAFGERAGELVVIEEVLTALFDGLLITQCEVAVAPEVWITGTTRLTPRRACLLGLPAAGS